MANWRKQGHQSPYQLGHWRSSSYQRKPPLPRDNLQSTVPSWEKKFCYSVGSITWGKLIECKKYMYLFPNVVNWDDSAGKEAFDNAKKRYWAEINGLPCDISLPDPDIYIDNVDWNSSVDPELVLDLESAAKLLPDEDKKVAEVVIVGGSLVFNNMVLTPTGWGDDDEKEAPRPVIVGGSLLLNNQSLTPTGWGDDEAEAPKPSDPNSFSQGWDSNLPENNGVNSWLQSYSPVQHAEEYEWENCQNDSQGWNQRKQHCGGELQNNAKGRSGGNGNGNWGTKWDGGYYRKRENMSWSNDNTSAAYHYGNEYQNQNQNRGRRNYRGGGGGGRRGHFGYDRSYVDKVPTSHNIW